MTQKRFRKLLLAQGCKRDDVDLLIKFIGEQHGTLSYIEAYIMLLLEEDDTQKI